MLVSPCKKVITQKWTLTHESHVFNFFYDVMYEQASQVASDAVGSIRTVASYCAEQKVMDMYQDKCEDPIKTGVRFGIVSGVSFGRGSSLVFLFKSFIFYIGCVLAKNGKATFAEIFKVKALALFYDWTYDIRVKK